jgi:hypothetical protein
LPALDCAQIQIQVAPSKRLETHPVGARAHGPGGAEHSGPAPVAEQIHPAAVLCNSLIQLMESVYQDLHLEREFDHPYICSR